jgi:DNA-binding PadR family transcriptional regulator
MAEDTRPLTELESCVLAVIWRNAPCSAYVVQKVFAASLTPEWSSSAGSIYPVLRRLLALALVAHEQEAWGRSTKAVYRPTGEGEAAVRQWISELGAAALTAPPDPVRTRAFFLDALSPAARLDALRAALQATETALTGARRSVQEVAGNGPVDELAQLGLVFQLEGRRAWLEQMASRLGPATEG